MGFSFKEFFIGGNSFCCFLPVRFGVITMSALSMLFSGILSIIIWFEVATAHAMSHEYRAVFIIAGLVETLLCVVSILGFVGAIVRKQLFVTIYAYFIYVHFLLNIAVATYFLWMITHAAKTDVIAACQQGLQNSGSKSQCTGLLDLARGVYFVIASFVLLTELYGAIIVTRYFRQLRGEKRSARASRIATDSAFSLKHARQSSDGVRLLSKSVYPNDEFDPYLGVENHNRPPVPRPEFFPDVENGYGGGQWSHDQILKDEKERLSDHHEPLVDVEALPSSSPNNSSSLPPSYGPSHKE